MNKKEAQAYLDSITSKLSEHFTSCQIVVTQVLPDGSTEWVASGSGDFYARKAACQEFVERDQARTVAHTIKDVNDT